SRRRLDHGRAREITGRCSPRIRGLGCGTRFAHRHRRNSPHAVPLGDSPIPVRARGRTGWTSLGYRRRLDASRSAPGPFACASHVHGAHPPHVHFHAHSHGTEHDVHSQAPEWLRRPAVAYAVVTLHGVAGSGAAAALAVLVAPSQAAAVVYLLSFGLGTLLGMVAVGALAFWPIA